LYWSTLVHDRWSHVKHLPEFYEEKTSRLLGLLMLLASFLYKVVRSELLESQDHINGKLAIYLRFLNFTFKHSEDCDDDVTRTRSTFTSLHAALILVLGSRCSNMSSKLDIRVRLR
jgi:hypothetical protein